MIENREGKIDITQRKKFSLGFYIVALMMVFAFTFQSLHSINSHTYTTGVDNFHYYCGCFGCAPIHISSSCDSLCDLGF